MKTFSTGEILTASDLNGNFSELVSGKAATVHSHQISDVTNLQSALDSKSETGHTHSYSSITDKPTIPTKTSDLTNDSGFLTAHQDISGKADKVDTYTKENVNSLLAGKAAADHTHTQAQVDGLTDALAGKAASVHTHAQSDVTGLETALAGKASSTHTHVQGDVDGLVDALAGKAASSHTHAQADVTGLVDALSVKIDSGYTYSKQEIDEKCASAFKFKGTKATRADLPTTGNTNGDVWQVTEDQSEHAWNGSAWVELGTSVDMTLYYTKTEVNSELAKKSNTGHTHAQSEIVDLATTLAGKSNTGHTHVQSEVTGLDTALAGKSNTGHTHAYSEITGTPTIPSKTSDLTNDSNFIDGLNGVMHIWQGTESEYNALTTKASDTLYIIK